MFEAYTALILVTTVSGLLWGVYQNGDTLHPLAYLMPMATYLYAVLPASLYGQDALQEYFSYQEIADVQGLNLACIVALALGCVAGSRSLRRDPRKRSRYSLWDGPLWRPYLFRGALVLGLTGVLVFFIGVYNVGGFYEAFNSPKGGGWAPTGYLRDTKLLVIPAILLLYLSTRGRRWTLTDKIWLGVFSIPLIARGILATSRGWFFMGAAALGAGWYLTRNRRPSFAQLLVGGVAVGLFMFLLQALRSELYFGSGFLSGQGASTPALVDEALNKSVRPGEGNEFIYGTYAFLRTRELGGFFWGARYFAYLFVRPIPSLLWPNKYADVGVEEITRNAGTLGSAEAGLTSFPELPPGQYPGIVGDLWVEFAWGAVPAIFLFGYFYASMWRRHLVRGGLWTVLYGGLIAFSVFAIMQTLSAAYFARLLVAAVPTILVWKIARANYQSMRSLVARARSS
jgi:hypothetical protein